MKKTISIINAVLFAFIMMISFPSLAQKAAASDQGKKTTVNGEVLDMQCYTSGGAHGADHKACAQKCIKGGAPIGLLDKDGNTILLVQDEENPGDYPKLADYAGDKVTVTGTLYNRGGMKSMVVATVAVSK